jgi:hypothetical protein
MPLNTKKTISPKKKSSVPIQPLRKSPRKKRANNNNANDMDKHAGAEVSAGNVPKIK